MSEYQIHVLETKAEDLDGFNVTHFGIVQGQSGVAQYELCIGSNVGPNTLLPMNYRHDHSPQMRYLRLYAGLGSGSGTRRGSFPMQIRWFYSSPVHTNWADGSFAYQNML